MGQSIQAEPNWAPSRESCEFYSCKHDELSCTRDNYTIEFDYKMCQKFLTLQDSATPTLAKWMPKVRLCLQKKLELFNFNDCSDLTSKAYKTHAQCYVKAGYCNLPFEDQNWVLNQIGLAAFSPDALSTALEIAYACRSPSVNY